MYLNERSQPNDRELTSCFLKTIQIWIDKLSRYESNLYSKPTPSAWSVGQLYMHLISETTYYLQQCRICASNTDYASERASSEAQTMFRNGDFPDIQIEGPVTNQLVPQPLSKQHLLNEMVNLQNEIAEVGNLLQTSNTGGKTLHPGLAYLDAQEWFRFGEMHFRHHLRQKKRIDDFLQQEKSRHL